MRGISLLKRRYTPFGRPPNWVSRAKTVHRTVFTPVLIFGRQKSFRRLRTTTLGFTPRPHDLFEKRSIKNFLRRFSMKTKNAYKNGEILNRTRRFLMLYFNSCG